MALVIGIDICLDHLEASDVPVKILGFLPPWQGSR
jgi:hypothetical protein